MKRLYTSDIHLTDNPLDDYKWAIFDWLKKHAINRKVDEVWILGDLTEKKNHHSAALVNRLTDSIADLASICKVCGIFGNHDRIEENTPFFSFLRRQPGVFFHSEAQEWGRMLVVPYSGRFRKAIKPFDLGKYDRILIHQPVQGAIAESGRQMGGIHPMMLREARSVIAGDVHVPQTIGNVIYCGAPHPVRFGDDFQPRVLFEDNGKLISIERNTIQKKSFKISDPEEMLHQELHEGDMARVEVVLTRSEFTHWDEIKNQIKTYAKSMGVGLHGIKLTERYSKRRLIDSKAKKTTDPLELLKRYGKLNQISKGLMDIGTRLLQEK